jgi:hypothetical protein
MRQVEHLNQGVPSAVVMALAVPEVAAGQVMHRDRVVILRRIGPKGEFLVMLGRGGDDIVSTQSGTPARGDLEGSPRRSTSTGKLKPDRHRAVSGDLVR